jgi:hypothetical protein
MAPMACIHQEIPYLEIDKILSTPMIRRNFSRSIPSRFGENPAIGL